MDPFCLMRVHTIYDRPLDYPDRIVVRGWIFAWGKPVRSVSVDLFTSLEDARHWLAFQGLYRLPRHKNDDPKIVESWI